MPAALRIVLARSGEPLAASTMLLSQFIAHADPSRVSACYVVTHVGSFHPKEDVDSDSYIVYDAQAGSSAPTSSSPVWSTRTGC